MAIDQDQDIHQTLVDFHQSPVWRKYALYSFIATVAIIGSFFVFKTSKAHVALYNPSTCLGGWEGTEHAQGEPDVTVENGQLFTKENSAYLTNAQAPIYCGDFRGALPDNAVQQKVTLKFSWTIDPTKIKSSEATTTPLVISNNFASSTSEIISLPDNSSVTVVSPNESQSTTTEQTSQASSTNEQAVAPVSDPESTPEPTETPQDSSEIQAPTEPASTATEESSSPQSEAVVPALDASAPITRNIRKNPTNFFAAAMEVLLYDVASTTSASNNDFLEVLYTYDGKTWQSLGTIDVVSLEGAQFEIPITATSTKEDLSRLQISLQTLPTVNEIPTVYLDGMWLEVSYDEKDADAQDNPHAVATSTQAEQDKLVPPQFKVSEVKINDVRVASVMAPGLQPALTLTAGSIENVSQEDLQRGWLSWSFLPASISITDKEELRQYIFLNFFGFNNVDGNLLINEDNSFVPKSPARIVIFGWTCVTEKCDTLQDMSEPMFISNEITNFRTLEIGDSVSLTPAGNL